MPQIRFVNIELGSAKSCIGIQCLACDETNDRKMFAEVYQDEYQKPDYNKTFYLCKQCFYKVLTSESRITALEKRMGLLEKSPSGPISDWLEERNHFTAAEDLRRNFNQ